MNATALESTSAAKAGWVISVLILAWLAFLFVPLPKEEEKAAAEVPTPPFTSLQKAGLPNYTDWEGLPEIFAVWADKAEWKDGKTRFAYWHPVMKNYSYFFEATRVDGGYRFKEIPELIAAREGEIVEDGSHWSDNLPEDCPIRFYYSYQLIDCSHYGLDPTKGIISEPRQKPKVAVDLNREPKGLPLIEGKIQPLDIQPKP